MGEESTRGEKHERERQPESQAVSRVIGDPTIKKNKEISKTSEGKKRDAEDEYLSASGSRVVTASSRVHRAMC